MTSRKPPQLRCFATTQALYAAAAAAFTTQACEVIAARGRFHVALAGGDTPRPLYELLATAPYRDALDWSQVHIWFGDERCVPPDSKRSNYRMVDEALLQQVPLSAAHIHRMHGEDEPEAAARAYERALLDSFGEDVPRLDLILLGIGADGHTASLFPGVAALRERQRRVCAQYVEVQQEWRLTLTLPVLNAAAALWVLAHGADKAEVLERVLTGPQQPDLLPIQNLAPASGRLEWWLDAAAAVRLQSLRR